jgi:hypothetical protein
MGTKNPTPDIMIFDLKLTNYVKKGCFLDVEIVKLM